MGFIIGVVLVFGCVVAGYAIPGGHLDVLYQPYEFLIIFGAAIGAFVISNPAYLIKNVMGRLKFLLKRSPYGKAHYVDLLKFLFTVFKFIRIKGMLEIEAAIENPDESELFQPFPGVVHNHHAMEFFCDMIRLMSMGVDNQYQMEDLMNQEIDIHHHEGEEVGGAVTLMGEALPALGIVAAVLGVIHTMGSIAEPPEILGHLIGAALVGTFAGVLFSYGVVGPMGTSLTKYADQETAYFNVIKIAIIANLQGHAPAIVVEFARKSIPGAFRPSFSEVEDAINGDENEG
jgi:chemotaxis protein MotA